MMMCHFKEMSKIQIERATAAQVKYLEILFNDNGFSMKEQRNAYLSAEFSRRIKFLDELTKDEASRIINILKEMKYSR